MRCGSRTRSVAEISPVGGRHQRQPSDPRRTSGLCTDVTRPTSETRGGMTRVSERATRANADVQGWGGACMTMQVPRPTSDGLSSTGARSGFAVPVPVVIHRLRGVRNGSFQGMLPPIARMRSAARNEDRTLAPMRCNRVPLKWRSKLAHRVRTAASAARCPPRARARGAGPPRAPRSPAA